MTLSLAQVYKSHRTAPVRATLSTYLAVWQQRRALEKLDPVRLRDMGISPAQATREAARPFWDLPC